MRQRSCWRAWKSSPELRLKGSWSPLWLKGVLNPQPWCLPLKGSLQQHQTLLTMASEPVTDKILLSLFKIQFCKKKKKSCVRMETGFITQKQIRRFKMLRWRQYSSFIPYLVCFWTISCFLFCFILICFALRVCSPVMFATVTLSKSISNESPQRSPRLLLSKIVPSNQTSPSRKQAFLPQEMEERGLETAVPVVLFARKDKMALLATPDSGNRWIK